MMMKLRDEIIDEIVRNRIPLSIRQRDDWPAITMVSAVIAADAILAKVREALLSDEAVVDGTRKLMRELDRGEYDDLPSEGPGAGKPGKWIGHELRREWRSVTFSTITAALDAVTTD